MNETAGNFARFQPCSLRPAQGDIGKEVEKWFPGQTLYPSGIDCRPGDENGFNLLAAAVVQVAKCWRPAGYRSGAILDVRDLAEWIIRMAEQGVTELITQPGRRRSSHRRKCGGHQAGDEIRRAVYLGQSGIPAAQKVWAWSACRCGSRRRASWPGFARSAFRRRRQGTDFRSFSDTTQATLDGFDTASARRANLKAE